MDFKPKPLDADDCLVVYEFQVGGHGMSSKDGPEKAEAYLLRNPKKATVLKPLISLDTRSEKEKEFFCRLSRDTTGLVEFVPQFFGIRVGTCPNGKTTEYIEMGDIAHGYRHPCIADVKIGRQAFADDAPQDKKLKQLDKYPVQETIGFRITGMKVWNRSTMKYDVCNKQFGRDLRTDDALLRAFGMFFGGPSINTIAIRDISERIRKLRMWFERQSAFRFFASSLLVIYEGDQLRLESTCKSDVRLIDFGHVQFVSDGLHDEGCLYGLRSLLTYFDRLLQMPSLAPGCLQICSPTSPTASTV